MAQFTIYRSSDSSAPSLTGQVGTLITLLDAVLVNGYGAKAAAGWTKPLATVSNSCAYKQGSAAKAGFNFVLHDNGLANTWEAKATGWKTVVTQTTPVGTGYGQFPMPAQLLTNGCVNIRKSVANNGTLRNWTIIADDRTVYVWIQAEGTTSRASFSFGEFYSLWGASDTNNCFIEGRTGENSASYSVSTGGIDRMLNPIVTTNCEGLFLSDNYSGTVGSQRMMICGDLSKTAQILAASTGAYALGSLPSPNPADGAYYLSPMNIIESSWNTRGRLRGLYHICHAAMADGSTITGTGDLAGKTFLVVYPAGSLGQLAVETSNTVDTN